MSCILHIETSTDVCSVALSEDSEVIFSQIDREGPNHAEMIPRFVDEALSFAESHAIPLDAVSVSSGPGSYTGLRIGVSMAKGVCYGRGVPLLSIPTLQLLCVKPLLIHPDDIEEGSLLCPMIDARRMEVYAAIYDRALRPVRQAQADVVDATTYKQWLDRGPVYFLGGGMPKLKDLLSQHPNARFIDGLIPEAPMMMPLAERKLIRGEVEDTAYFEPFYLKDYQAALPKNPLAALAGK